MNKLLLITTFAAATFAAGCQTFSGSSSAKGGPDTPKDVVVGQPGTQDTVVSAHERGYWVDLRQKKNALPRIHGALATGEAEAAVDNARALLAKRPGDLTALRLLSAALAMDKKYELAAYYASLVEKQKPNDAVALNIKGIAAMAQPRGRVADYKLAASYFQRAFEADGSQIAAGLNLGSLQLELGDAGGAATTFDQVVKRCGGCSAGLMGAGIAAARSRHFDKAKSSFEQVLARNPRHAGALYQLALVHKNGYNDRKQAEKYLFALINDQQGRQGRGASKTEPYLKERAHSVLRAMKGEASEDERLEIADDERQPAGGKNDARDAELLMSGADME